jgi:hypothetical protein
MVFQPSFAIGTAISNYGLVKLANVKHGNISHAKDNKLIMIKYVVLIYTARTGLKRSFTPAVGSYYCGHIRKLY